MWRLWSVRLCSWDQFHSSSIFSSTQSMIRLQRYQIRRKINKLNIRVGYLKEDQQFSSTILKKKSWFWGKNFNGKAGRKKYANISKKCLFLTQIAYGFCYGRLCLIFWLYLFSFIYPFKFRFFRTLMSMKTNFSL